jgi:hypothetical protein
MEEEEALLRELAAVNLSVKSNAEATQLEAARLLKEGHNWSPDQRSASRYRLDALAEAFARLAEKRQQIEQQLGDHPARRP